jgi:predicted phage terminase large subunit-like protein
VIDPPLTKAVTRYKVDKLMIEAKASGISAAQELRNRYGRRPYAVQLCKVSGDKVARALAVQATFSHGMVYTLVRDWSEALITQASVLRESTRHGRQHDDGVPFADPLQRFPKCVSETGSGIGSSILAFQDRADPIDYGHQVRAARRSRDSGQNLTFESAKHPIMSEPVFGGVGGETLHRKLSSEPLLEILATLSCECMIRRQHHH